MFGTEYIVVPEAFGVVGYKIQYRKWWQIKWRDYDMWFTSEKHAKLACDLLNKEYYK